MEAAQVGDLNMAAPNSSSASNQSACREVMLVAALVDELWASVVCLHMISTGIKDAGIAVRHSRGRILFSTAASRHGLGEMPAMDRDTKRTWTDRKIYVFIMEKYIADAKQDQKAIRMLWNR